MRNRIPMKRKEDPAHQRPVFGTRPHPLEIPQRRIIDASSKRQIALKIISLREVFSEEFPLAEFGPFGIVLSGDCPCCVPVRELVWTRKSYLGIACQEIVL